MAKDLSNEGSLRAVAHLGAEIWILCNLIGWERADRNESAKMQKKVIFFTYRPHSSLTPTFSSSAKLDASNETSTSIVACLVGEIL